jgi:hypothetical protein
MKPLNVSDELNFMMRGKIVILAVINLVVYANFLIGELLYGLTPFLTGVIISFSVSTLIGVIGSLQTVFVSIFLAWGLYLLALFEGFDSSLLAGCALALTIGVMVGFIISRPW